MKDDSRQPLSRKVYIPYSRINLYMMVIVLRLIILGFFLHYRITNPVPDAYALWLISMICEIWFTISWILDQLTKWLPVNRETYLDRLALRFDREGELSIIAADHPVYKFSCYAPDEWPTFLFETSEFESVRGLRANFS